MLLPSEANKITAYLLTPLCGDIVVHSPALSQLTNRSTTFRPLKHVITFHCNKSIIIIIIVPCVEIVIKGYAIHGLYLQ